MSPRTRHALSLAPSERFSTGCIATLTDGSETSRSTSRIGRRDLWERPREGMET